MSGTVHNVREGREMKEESGLPNGYWEERLLQLFADVLLETAAMRERDVETEAEIVQFTLPGLFA